MSRSPPPFASEHMVHFSDDVPDFEHLRGPKAGRSKHTHLIHYDKPEQIQTPCEEMPGNEH